MSSTQVRGYKPITQFLAYFSYRFMILEVLRFLYVGVLAWNCLFAHFRGNWYHISLNDVNRLSRRPNPKRTILARKHVDWADVERENRSSGLI